MYLFCVDIRALSLESTLECCADLIGWISNIICQNPDGVYRTNKAALKTKVSWPED